jgi:hypothetical protein
MPTLGRASNGPLVTPRRDRPVAACRRVDVLQAGRMATIGCHQKPLLAGKNSTMITPANPSTIKNDSTKVAGRCKHDHEDEP